MVDIVQGIPDFPGFQVCEGSRPEEGVGGVFGGCRVFRYFGFLRESGFLGVIA